MSTPTIPILLNVLTQTLPDFLKLRSANTRSLPPVKLLVIDALAELFHFSTKTTTTTLVERAKYITELSTLLHSLASTYQIAILVLNEVSDVINRDLGPDISTSQSADVQYSDQARWFSRAHSIPGEDGKEACLGLVWANQVNARIMLSRTGRRRYREEVEILTRKQKKNKTGNEGDNSPPTFSVSVGRATPVIEEQAVLIRRLSVIFNSVGRPQSLDYVVTVDGVFTLPDGSHRPIREVSAPGQVAQNAVQALVVSPLDLGSTGNGSEDPEDAWDGYWRDEIPDELYNEIDLDALLDSNNTTSSQPSIRDECSSST
jgi:DNA repair protein RAD57